VRTVNNTRLVFTKSVLWFILGVASIVAVVRFVRGLGPVTALTDTTPWGLWIGFDVVGGVALAAGGFVLAAAVHILHLERYHVLVRPAILTAFLGYLAVVFGLLADLGRPWNIWRMTFWWQPDSPLFEVGWCVMLYLTVLILEFAPVVFEGLRWNRALTFMRRITLLLVVAGIGLSTLHQSSLGTLFLLIGHRMHPLWYTPIIPLLFLVSAIGLGLCMVATESLVSSWLFRREAEWPVLRGLTRAAAVVLSLYLVLRLGDLIWRGNLAHMLDGTWASALFIVEIAVSALAPVLLFTLPGAAKRPRVLASGAALGVFGFVLHRINVAGLAHVSVTGDPYFPALTELSISLGVVSFMALVFLFFVEHFPVWEEQPDTETHFAPPLLDPVSHTFFGGPWFSRWQMGGLAWVVGVVCGLILLETTTGDGARPRPEPVRAARNVFAERVANPTGLGYRLQQVPTARLAAAEAEADVQPVLLIDANRDGRLVLFAHRAHQEREGGLQSCATCHHRNLRMDEGTPCSTCHLEMYRVTDTFDHAPHVGELGGNHACERCHDAAQPKSRSTAASCESVGCHAAETSQQARIQKTGNFPPGMAPGYREALHGLCIHCHQSHEAEQAVAEPYLSRCAWCHEAKASEPVEGGPGESASIVAARLD